MTIVSRAGNRARVSPLIIRDASKVRSACAAAVVDREGVRQQRHCGARLPPRSFARSTGRRRSRRDRGAERVAGSDRRSFRTRRHRRETTIDAQRVARVTRTSGGGPPVGSSAFAPRPPRTGPPATAAPRTGTANFRPAGTCRQRRRRNLSSTRRAVALALGVALS
jgi:hypothetical protein